MFEFFTISLVILLAAISPGPDFVLVTRNSLRYSQKAGVLTAFGIAVGMLFHVTYCILGFAIIISKSLLLFSIIKYLGAAYLIYLGIKGLLEKKSSNEFVAEKVKSSISNYDAFLQGLLCNVLNPKAVMFFLALFTILIKPSMPIPIQIAYGIEVALIHLLWFASVSVVWGHDKIKIFLGKFLHYITKAFGGALLLLGVKIAMLSR